MTNGRASFENRTMKYTAVISGMKEGTDRDALVRSAKKAARRSMSSISRVYSGHWFFSSDTPSHLRKQGRCRKWDRTSGN
jgi:hypothetical protein